jgi:O-succinylbenzoate synthase
VIRFHHHSYSLVPLSALNSKTSKAARSGELLKVTWSDQMTGYADLFPWPELGDEDISAQLQKLKQGLRTPLTEQAIALAQYDALFRSQKRSAFQPQAQEAVKNHFTVVDISNVDLKELKTQGFTTLKVKVGCDWPHELTWLKRAAANFILRLDFNSQAQFSWLESLPSDVKAKVEFVEDPVPFNFEDWKKASKLVPLALDNEYDKVDWSLVGKTPPFQTMVIKPARQNVAHAMARAQVCNLSVVVTSSMDHPVGVAHALRVAMDLKARNIKILECGLLTTSLYEANSFSPELKSDGPYLIPPSGTGIGFNHLLEELAWTDLA